MLHFRLSLLLLAVLFSAVFAAGCLEKTVYPALITTVVTVTPSDLQPTTGTDTLELPSAEIELRSETQVPARLVSYHVTFETPLGQPMESLRIPETPVDQYLTPGSSNQIVVRPYTTRVVDLYSSSASDIEPIRATITLTIKDENGNLTYPQAHCLLYKPA